MYGKGGRFMIKSEVHNKITIKELVLLLSSFIIFYFISAKNYIFFHSVIETIITMISFSLMLISLGTLKISENSYFAFLGITLGFIGIIDWFHIFTYKGINIFSSNSNTPTQLWVLGRYYECFIMFLSFRYIKREIHVKKLILFNAIFLIVSLSSIIVFSIFPDCYVEGIGLTTFKRMSEYLSSMGFFIIILKYIRSKNEVLSNNRYYLIQSMIFRILSSLAFSLYFDVYGISNFLGHIFRFISFYFIFKILFENIITKTYSILFHDINRKAVELEEANKLLKEANAKIKEGNVLYKKFIDFIPDGIIVLRKERITSVNNRFCDMVGIKDEEEIINRNIYFIIDKPYYALLNSRLNIKDKDKLLSSVEYEIVWGDKKVFVEMCSLHVEDEEGGYLISAIRDITDRKRAEEAHNLLLEKQKSEQIKNDFFANISHEFKTPINVIYSALQLQKDSYYNSNMDSVIKCNKIIKQNCLRLIRLINNLIDLTKIETGFFKPNMKIENIINIVEDVSLSIVDYVESKNMNLIFDTEVEELYINCDVDLIERIMLNLLSNAVKYGKEQGNIQVSVYQRSGNSVGISVKDNGVGIPQNMYYRIFQRFEKVDKSLSRNAEGSGIGLSLVKSLVEMQGGTIDFNSKINEGTEFLIVFPIEEQYLEAAITTEKVRLYEKSIIEAIEIEFSDIYS